MAATPVVYNLVADTWTLVATAVRFGVTWLTDVTPTYKQTYVLTGAAAPVVDTLAVNFVDCYCVIDSDDPIDVYVKSVSVAGSVRVDL